MPLILNGKNYYRTAEVCRTVGISRNTLLRWIKQGIFKEVEHRDRRGWRLFTDDDLKRLRAEVNRIRKTNPVQK